MNWEKGLGRIWWLGTIFILVFTMYAETNGLEIYGVDYKYFDDYPNSFILIPQIIWWALYWLVLWIISGFEY